jgi:hypothetical protein
VDLDGDGLLEVIGRSGSRIHAWRYDGSPFWQPLSYSDLLGVRLDSTGVVAQIGDRVRRVRLDGGLGGTLLRAPRFFVYEATWTPAGDRTLDVFAGGSYAKGTGTRDDLDGDGSPEALIHGPTTVSAWSGEGKPVLEIRFAGGQFWPVYQAADLDGIPGSEILLLVRQYDLVALGRLPSSTQERAAR